MKDLEPFELLKSDGVGAAEAYQKAAQLDWNTFDCIRMLRLVYRLSLSDAKAVKVAVEHDGMPLSDYEGSLMPDIEAALKELDDT